MRRNDEEFKAELLLRVKKYKERQQKRRENALRAASAAVMVCVLVVSSQWGKIAQEDWHRPTEGPEATEGDSVTEALDKTQEDFEDESIKVPVTENNAVGIPETGAVQDEITDAPAELVGFTGISIREQKIEFNSESSTESFNAMKNYPDGELAETLLEFLTERIEAAKESVKESVTTEELESSENASTGGNLDNGSLGKRYQITIRFSDGGAVAYQVAEGNSELKIKGGRLILDQESWGQLMQIMEITQED